IRFESKHRDILPDVIDSFSLLSDDLFSVPDSQIDENHFFKYPVIMRQGMECPKGVIILLHGLNERDWAKYLPWGVHLAKKTGKAVLLFPISFHMNRAPLMWNNPRIMNHIAVLRKRIFPKLYDNSYLNAALSSRLESNPKRFLLSGLESYYDILDLTAQIRNGKHPMFDKNVKIDFFSYSIGAFFTQLIIMANPRSYYANSKAFFFCGGATFNQMNGVSKFIFDSKAGKILQSYFVKHFDRELKKDPKMQALILKTKIGMFFNAMLNLRKMRSFREERLLDLSRQIKAIALVKDHVIPAKGIVKTLCGKRNRIPILVTVRDFPFEYTHENPFPINKKDLNDLIDQSFQEVFNEASAFLN
ncbi:MAG: DUF6051 family protein, partial [Bacteroidota bacterium]|nr:DUF6051 family protein [Bacteroidota bacterium]